MRACDIAVFCRCFFGLGVGAAKMAVVQACCRFCRYFIIGIHHWQRTWQWRRMRRMKSSVMDRIYPVDKVRQTRWSLVQSGADSEIVGEPLNTA